MAVATVLCLVVVGCQLGGEGKRWDGGTHMQSFVIVITHHLSCVVWLPHCQLVISTGNPGVSS